MIEAYPLCWPVNKDRTPVRARKRAQFGKQTQGEYYKSKRQLTVAEALARVMAELDRFSFHVNTVRIPRDTIVVSTNIRTGAHGMPLSGKSEPVDPGVAVYFTLDGRAYCTPCDAWDRVADNLAAVAAHLECLRSIERYKVGESHDVFTGHRALPWFGPMPKQWWEVLEVRPDADWQEVLQSYERKLWTCHPDKGGTTEAFQDLQKAYEIARKYLAPAEVAG